MLMVNVEIMIILEVTMIMIILNVAIVMVIKRKVQLHFSSNKNGNSIKGAMIMIIAK